MRNIILPAFALIALASYTACSNHGRGEVVAIDSIAGLYGEAFDTSNIQDVKTLPLLFAKNGSATQVVSGKMMECCQKKGCWMTLDMGNDQTMRVTFKDYGFFMPLNSAGRTLVMSGTATNDTTTVEALRHYAQDAGKSEDEIQAITEPEIEMVFEATGVYIR